MTLCANGTTDDCRHHCVCGQEVRDEMRRGGIDVTEPPRVTFTTTTRGNTTGRRWPGLRRGEG